MSSGKFLCLFFDLTQTYIPVVNIVCLQIFCEVNSQYFNKVLCVVYFDILYFLSILQILAFARGVILVLEILMVVPVDKFYCSKKLRASIMDCSVSRKRLVSSAYCDNLAFFFRFGMGYPIILLFLMLRLITSPFIMQRKGDKGHPCLSPLDKEKEVDRKPLLK